MRQPSKPATETLDALLSEVSKCELCVPTLPLGPRPLLKISRRVRLLIIGQAPGRVAHTTGVPWDDKSGERLRTWLDVSPERFYAAPELGLMPMGFCYPGTGSGGDLAPRSECAPAWHERLLAQMPALELTLVIGRYAQVAYLPGGGGASVTESVKAWRTLFPRWLALPHPSPRNNRWLKSNPWFEEDVVPALRRETERLVRPPIR